MQVFTIVSIGVLGAILALTVRQFRPEAGLFIGIATGTLVLLLTMAELTGHRICRRAREDHRHGVPRSIRRGDL